MKIRWAALVATLWVGLLAGCAARPPSGPAPGRSDAPPGQARAAYIDTHAHVDGRAPGLVADFDGAVRVALDAMDALSITKALVMPPPFPSYHPIRYDYEDFLGAVRAHPQRFAFLGGGGSLNGFIQEAVTSGQTSPSLRRRFEERAERILRDGAVGFGEMTAEHLSFRPLHPYESAPPDHPLFLLLADIAARHGVPIDLHMEAVARDMPLPPRFSSPPNPPTLRENIVALERLLAHNRRARIVWVHVGWDNTGDRTVDLCRRLLAAHPNLYMSLKIDPLSLPDTRPLTNGVIRREWVELIRVFPDRFVIGSDQFYGSPRIARPRPPSAHGPRAFLDLLPPDLARKVGVENAVRLYNLAPARERAEHVLPGQMVLTRHGRNRTE